MAQFCYFAHQFEMSMEFLGIVLPRYGSTRLEGKPLADINGKHITQWIYEKASKIHDVVLAEFQII